MTRTEFLSELHTAIDHKDLDARVLTAHPHIYPRGVFIRWKVRVQESTYPYCDPITLVWYARTGEFKTVLDALGLANVLGLDADEGLALLDASDSPVAGLEGAAVEWRLALEQIIADHTPVVPRP